MVNLNVPFDSQVSDERENPETQVGKEFWRNCNINCLSMVLDFFGYKVSEKQLYDLIEGDSGHIYANTQGITGSVLRVYYRMLAWAAREITGKSEIYCRDIPAITKMQCQNILRAGYPVIIGGWFTDSGHVVVLRGFDNLGWFVNDPAGDRYKGYFNFYGDNVHYKYIDVDRLIFGADGKCWTSMAMTDGKKTVLEAMG
jgi:hypothetical protein